MSPSETKHQAFYQRAFNHQVLCEARPYPQLGKPISLMSLHFPSAATQLYQKYPFFRSSVFERRRLFEHPQHQSATVPEALHSLKTARTAR